MICRLSVVLLSMGAFGVAPAAQGPASIVQGVAQVWVGGGPGNLSAFPGSGMEAIVSGGVDPFALGLYAVAGSVGAGRVVAVGSDGALSDAANRVADTLRFNTQAMQWLHGGAPSPRVWFTSGHAEVEDVNTALELRNDLLNLGMAVGDISGTVTLSRLSSTNVLVIGNAWGTFSTAELNDIEAFVRGGGGLYLAGLGWSYGAERLSNYPMNTVGARFGIEWLADTISDPTNSLNGSPLFTTFYPNCGPHLPGTALQHLQNLYAQHPTDLDSYLRSDPAERSAYMTAAASVARFAAQAPSSLRMNFDVQVRGLMQNNPRWLSMSGSFDKSADAALGLGRAALGAGIASAYPHDPLRLDDIERALGMSQVAPEYSTILREHGFLLLDNRSFRAPHFAMLLDQLEGIAGVERDLQRMTVRNEIAADPNEQRFPIPGLGVNIFEPGSLNPGRLENQFPPDHPARTATVFSTTVVHEIGHVVDSLRSRVDPAFAARKAALLAAAGNDDMQFLRAIGSQNAQFFQTNPQEFFASLSNQWCVDSIHTLGLALSRFDRGFHEPMRQALFIAEAYSANGATTPLFDMNHAGRTTIETATFVRDAQGRITALCSDSVDLRFEYDSADNLTAAYEADRGSFVLTGRGCPSCASQAIHEILPAGGWDLDGDSLFFDSTAGTGGTQISVRREALATPLGLSPSAFDVQAGDDTVSAPHPLGFSFPYVRGTNATGVTATIEISSNGYVYLETGTITGSRCCDGQAGYAPFLNETASVAVLGTDLNPSAAGSVLVETQVQNHPVSGFPEMVCVIEWRGVPVIGSAVPNTVQAQLWQSGSIVICHTSTWGENSQRSALVGVSPGGGLNACPGIDFTAALPYTPTAPFAAGTPMTLSGSGSFGIGGQLDLTITNPVVGNPGGSALFMGSSTLDVPLSVIGGPAGCSLLVNPFFTFNRPAGTANFSIPLPNGPQLLGANLHFQYVASDLSQAGSYAVPVFTSNRGTVTLGSPDCGEGCSSALELGDGANPGSNVGSLDRRIPGICAPLGSGVWYRYTATCTGTATVSTCASQGGSADFDTVMAAFSGDCANLNLIDCNDDSCGLLSEVSFAVTEGSVYYIAIGGYEVATGNYVLHVDCR